MIKAEDAIRTARGLLGTPYSELDCINLIKRVIRASPGGVPGYTTAGTNTLWKSFEASGKYRDLTWRGELLPSRQGRSTSLGEGGIDARAGMLVFKRSGTNVHHVGLMTERGTVIHSSSVYGRVTETALDASWNLMAVHRYIEVAELHNATDESEDGGMESYRARVVLEDTQSTLNVRNEPGRGGDIIGKLHHGTEVTVQAEFENGWKYVSYGDSGLGYVSGEYLERVEETVSAGDNVISVSGDAVIIDGEGNTFRPIGGWRVVFGAVD